MFSKIENNHSFTSFMSKMNVSNLSQAISHLIQLHSMHFYSSTEVTGVCCQVCGDQLIRAGKSNHGKNQDAAGEFPLQNVIE